METHSRANPKVRVEPGVDTVGRHRQLFRRTTLVSGLTLVSRVLGYVREIMSAALFGDRSAVFDAFITAWRVPNLFRRFLGEGALSTSFQTALTKADAEGGLVAGRLLFHKTLRLLTWLSALVCLLSALAVASLPDQMPFSGWAWLGSDPEPVRELTVRVMPFLVLVSLSALVGGALQVRGHFASPAWAPAVLNLVWIVVLASIALTFGIDAGAERHLEMTRVLAWGVLLAGALQLAVQVPALFRTGFLGSAPAAPRGSPQSGGAWRVLKQSAPLAFGAAVYQINVMLDGLMAEGLLANGGPALHYYANRVQQFPMALVAIAATSAVFPALQAIGQRRDLDGVRRLHDQTQRAIAFVALPASVGLFVLSREIISVSFERGAFGPEGVERASAALRMLSLAILPAGASGLAARTYYALGDFRTPVRVSIFMLALNAALNVLFISGFGMDVDGLALATAISAFGTFGLLGARFGPVLGLPSGREALAGPLLRIAVAALACGFAGRAVESALDDITGPAPALLAGIGLAIGVYWAITYCLRVEEARAFAAKLKRR